MAQRHQHRSAAKQHAPETGPAIPCVYWMLAELGTRTDRDVVGILAENTTVSKANASGNNTGPGPQLPPHPRAKGESEPLLFRGPVHCMLIHNSSKLGEGVEGITRAGTPATACNSPHLDSQDGLASAGELTMSAVYGLGCDM